MTITVYGIKNCDTIKSTVDLREGGKFVSLMEAKDGSLGFDFEGVYTVRHRAHHARARHERRA